MNNNRYFFSNGSSSLVAISKSLNKQNKRILIPNFICEEVIDALEENDIKYEFYYINKNLYPDLEDIEKKNFNNYFGILIVNYFGLKPNSDLIKNLKRNKKIYMIEDNCHGMNINNNLEDNFDASFDSPRKYFGDLQSGSNLITRKNIILDDAKFKKLNSNYIHWFFLYFKVKIKFFLKEYFNIRIHNPIKNNKKNFQIYLGDRFSEYYFKRKDKKKIQDIRYKNFNKWHEIFSEKLKINLIEISKFEFESNFLWFYPLRINKDIQSKVEDVLTNQKINFINWPKFPKNTELDKIKKDWDNLLCLPLDRVPDIKILELFEKNE